MTVRAIWAVGLAIGVSLLSGCGIFTSSSPVHKVSIAHVRMHKILSPHIRWFSATLGPEVLLNDGAQVSSVLSGPQGRIYYGTSSPLADANTIGWINPRTAQNQWQTVPKVSPHYPSHASQSALGLSQSTYWNAVDLIVAGQHTVWYRHWGYVGGWAQNGKFIPGDYTIPGPTVTQGQWTASIHTTFQGQSTLHLANLANKTSTTISLPHVHSVQSLTFVGSSPTLWLMSQTGLWRMQTDHRWVLVDRIQAGDFFVSFGHWTHRLWIVDANGRVGTVSSSRIVWKTTLPISPLGVVTAGSNGLWIARQHHLSLWIPGQKMISWPWPQAIYPSPASGWPTSGPNAPADWPPIAHISPGPHGTLDIGYGPWIGQASFVWQNVPVGSKNS